MDQSRASSPARANLQTTQSRLSQMSSAPLSSGSQEFLSALVSRKINVISYIRNIHTGYSHYFNTVLLKKETAHLFDVTRMRERASNYMIFGISLSRLLHIQNCQTFIQAVSVLLAEYEYHESSESARQKMASKVKKMKQHRTVGESAEEDPYTPVLSFLESGTFSYLQTSKLDFNLDYVEIIHSLCDVLVDIYAMFTSSATYVPDETLYLLAVSKIDANIKKIFETIMRDLYPIAKAHLKSELRFIDPLIVLKKAAYDADLEDNRFEFLIDTILANQMFTAGAGLVGMGTALALMRQGVKMADYSFRRNYLTTLEIPSHDKSYLWVLHWITQKAAKNTRHLSIRTLFVQHDNGSISTQFRFVPGTGTHYFQWRKTWFQIERQKEKGAGRDSVGVPNESVTLTAFTRDQSVLLKMLEEAKSQALAEEEGKTVVYTSWGQEWRPFGYPRKRRPMSSVVLDEGLSESILNDVKDFLFNGKWYMDRGIPYRRGYLLYGPPGSGKSSFIQALAGELEYNICVLNLAEKYLSDDRLNLLLSVVPQRSIILLEDIDAAFTNSRDKKNEGGFLNALDGVVSSEGRIIFMTTNHIDRLDPAILRPGRVDCRKFIGDASPFQIRKMFLRFYENETELAEKFVNAVSQFPVSTAQLQGHFVFYKNDPQAAFDNLESLKSNR